MNESLDILRILVDFGLVILIWLVQIIIYPNFISIQSSRFTAWHRQYTIRISVIVFPLMVVQLGLYIYSLLTESFTAYAPPLITILLLWMHTFLVAVPLHQKLEESGNSEDLCQRLVRKNWWRVMGWNLVFILSVLRLPI